MVLAAGTQPDGTPLCAGSWRPQSFDVGKSDFDILFGAAFMRSVYSVFDFGDFAADNQTMGQPYLKFWSLVNGSDASNDFHAIRGGVKNSTFLSNQGVNDPGADSTPHDGTGNSASSGGGGPDLSTLQSSVDNINKLVPILFAITGLNLAILVGIIAIFLFMRSKRRRRNGTAKGGKPNKGRTSALAKDPEDLAPPESPGSFIALPRPRAPALQNEYRPLSSGATLRDSMLYDAPKSPGSMGKFNPEAKYDPPLHPRQSIAETIPEELEGSSGRLSMAEMMATRRAQYMSGGPFSPASNGSFDSLPMGSRQSMDPFSRQSAVVLESDLAGQSLTSPSMTVTPPEEADLTSAVDESDEHLRDGTAIPLVPMIPPPPQEPPQREEGSRTPPPRQGVLPPGSPPTLRRPAFVTPPGPIPALRHSDVYGGLQAPDAARFEQMRHSIAGNEGVQQFEPPPREAFTSWRGPPEAGPGPAAPPTVTVPAPAMPGRLFPMGGNTLTVDTFTPPRAVSLYDAPVMPQPSLERPMSQYELGVATPPVVPPRSSARFSHLPSRTASGGDGGASPSPLRQHAVDENPPPPSRSRASSRTPSIAESRKDV